MTTSEASRPVASPDRPLRLTVGDRVPSRTLPALQGPVPFPVPGALTHLQLRRFAGCPVCNLHLRSFALRATEIADAGVHEIVVFHSSGAELERYQPELPFLVVPDPARELYREFGVERSLRAVLSPRLLLRVPRVLAGVTRGLRQDHSAPRLFPHGGQRGLPADFLLDGEGRVVALKYGEHAYDQWSVDELLAHALEADVPR